ncbi:LLM class flavin-dependent oxidoreductase [Xanthobacter sp. V4C-4]|uniref:LLM class flavin-dependent oxidoreductase n=1 Tax=Xanthobacter cornucopiae TaxID=3119924 RepID=UPI00372B6EB2
MPHPVFNVNVWDFGANPAAWRSSRLGARANLDPAYWREIAGLLERGGFQALFLADSPSLNEEPQIRPTRFLEPCTIQAALAGSTSRLGLIATMSSTFNDPVDLAEQALLLDAVSGGRFGVNMVTTTSPIAARLFGHAGHPDRAVRYARAFEFVQVFRDYWTARRRGEGFCFKGRFFRYDIADGPPLDVPAEPFLLQAGGSAEGAGLAGRFAHAVFAAEMQKEAAIANRKAVRDAAAACGRPPPRYLPGLTACLGSTREEARRNFEAFQHLGAPDFLLRHLNKLLDLSIGAEDLDTRAVAYFDRFDVTAPTSGGSMGFRKSVYAFAAEGDLSLRQLLQHFGAFGHQIVFGTPQDVADLIEDWYRAGACDGFNIIPDVFPSGLERFIDHVLPLLTRRGLFRHPDDGGVSLFGRGRYESAAPPGEGRPARDAVA